MNQPNGSKSEVDPTYWEYIRLDRLLTAQGGVEAKDEVESADELHFIVIHQAIELLFKLVLRELRETRASLGRPHLDESSMPEVAAHLGRVNEALGVVAGHFAFMESLGTQGFLSFRDKLGTSSGAQSFQMRELEELLGLPLSERERILRRLRAELADPLSGGTPQAAAAVAGFESFVLAPLETIAERINRQIQAKQKLGVDAASDRFTAAYIEKARLDIRTEGTLRASLARWLYRTPICGSAPEGEAAGSDDRRWVREFVGDYLERGQKSGWREDQVQGARRFLQGEEGAPLSWLDERVRAALLFIETYSDLPLLAWPRRLLDGLVELEAKLVAFRNGHARMVERVIGDRPGTGGSAGIKYLDLTRDSRVFPELVQVRGLLLPRPARRLFAGIERYDFVHRATES